MVWIAVVLGVFLFYKFVERRHKIVFFKVSGIVVAIGLLGLGGFLGYEKLTEKPYNAGIRVSYSYHSSKVPKERRVQIANKIFEKFRGTDPVMQNLSLEEQNFLKNLFYDQVYFESKIHSQYVDATKEENDLGFEAFTEEDPRKKAENKKRENELASVRLDKHLAELPAMREALKDDAQKLRHNYKLFVRRMSFDSTPELKKKFESALLPWEKYALDHIDQVKADQAEKMRHALSDENADSEISITICNDKDVPLLSYSFYVAGLEHGRSSRHALNKGAIGDDTRLEGDIVVKPKTCTTPTWTGKFSFFERYEISLVSGNWESEK